MRGAGNANRRRSGRVAALAALALLAAAWEVPGQAEPAQAGPTRAERSGPRAVILTGPADRTPSKTAAFTFDRVPGVRHSVRLDDQPWRSVGRAARFTGLREGAHTVSVRAVSAAGVPGPVTRTRFVVDLVPPGTSVAGVGRRGAVLGPGTALRFGSDEPGSRFACSVDGGAFLACASPYPLDALGAGRHALAVRATDRAGNVDPSAVRRELTIDPDAPFGGASRADRAPPRTRITSAPSGTVGRSSVLVSFASSEPGSFQCRLDDGAYAPCTSGHHYTGLAAGRHTVAVRAIDAAGNVDISPATSSWTARGEEVPAVLIADNQNRRILITTYDGTLLWKFRNPTGEDSEYSGPLGVRWTDDGHILATFGTGKVGEIDPETKSFVWVTEGYNEDYFRSPYDAQVLPDGNLAVASARNGGGRVAVYDMETGDRVWKRLVNFAHLVELVPGDRSHDTRNPTLLMAGFSKLYEVVYAPGRPRNKDVVYRWDKASNVHRAILDRDRRSLVVTNKDTLTKVARPQQKVTWKRFQGNHAHGETRGVAMTAGGYVFGYRIWRGDSQIRFTNGKGVTKRKWTTLSDGSQLNLPWGVRTITFPAPE